MIHMILDITAIFLRSLLFYLNYAKARIHLNVNKWDSLMLISHIRNWYLFPLPCISGSPLVGFLRRDQAACFSRTTMTLYPQSRCRSVIIGAKAQEAFTQNWLKRSCYSWQGCYKQILPCLLLFCRNSLPVLQLVFLGTASPCRPL